MDVDYDNRFASIMMSKIIMHNVHEVVGFHLQYGALYRVNYIQLQIQNYIAYLVLYDYLLNAVKVIPLK